jgi:hypothetical protein
MVKVAELFQQVTEPVRQVVSHLTRVPPPSSEHAAGVTGRAMHDASAKPWPRQPIAANALGCEARRASRTTRGAFPPAHSGAAERRPPAAAAARDERAGRGRVRERC